MLFYLTSESGEVTGPHTAGAVTRKLEAGEMVWEDMVCVQGTEDWVPAHVYEDVLDARGRQARADEARRVASAPLVAAPAGRDDTVNAWVAACAMFLLGLAMQLMALLLGNPLLGMLSGVPALAAVISGLVLLFRGRVGNGVAAVVLGLLVMPIVWWVKG